MKRLVMSLLLVVAIALPVAAADADTEAAGQAEAVMTGSITVGDFLVEMARIVDPTLPAVLPVEEAVARLQQAGLVVDENTDLESILTEGDVVRFASTVGVRLKTMNPNETFEAGKVGEVGNLLRDALTGASAASSVLASSANNPNCDPTLGNCGDGSERAREKRKKKKSFESPTGGGF